MLNNILGWFFRKSLNNFSGEVQKWIVYKKKGVSLKAITNELGFLKKTVEDRLLIEMLEIKKRFIAARKQINRKNAWFS